MKHFNITILLTLLMSMVGARALAYDALIDGIYYRFNGTEATVTYLEYNSSNNANAYSGDIVIPETVSYNNKTYNVTTIGASAFYLCEDLNSITIPNSIVSIGSSAFRACSGLSSINIPNSVSTIWDEAFSGCSKLTSIVIPDGVTSIGNCAFQNCSLTSVSIPSSINSIGNNAFQYCYELETVNISDLAGWCNINFGSKYSNPLCYAHHLYLNSQEIKDLAIPNGVTSIGKYTFNGCSELTSVTIPGSVTSIANDAFEEYLGVITLSPTTPPTLSSQNAFNYYAVIRVPDTALEAYRSADVWSDFANRIVGIGTQIDYNITVSADDSRSTLHETIGEEHLQNVVTLKVTGTINSYDIMVLRNKMDNLHHLDLSDANIVANNYEYYTGYHTENNVLGSYSFYGQSKLVSVKLPKSITRIDNRAFQNCANLKDVEFQTGIESIGDYAFQFCGNMRTINLKTGLKTIGNYAFGVDIDYNYGDQPQEEELIIPEGVTSIGNYAFGCNYKLKQVYLPSTLKRIYRGTFRSCSSLVTISLPTSLESIPNEAFCYCSKLARVDIPSTITSIGENAFYQCNNLKDVYTYIVEPTPINMNTFSTYTTATLHVPSTSYYNYWYDTEWSQFRTVEEFMAEYQYFYINNDFTIGDEKGTISAGLGQDDPDADLNGGSGLIVESSTYNKQYLDEMHIKAWGEDCASVITASNLDANKVYFDIEILANRWYFLAFPFDVKKTNITAPGKDYTFRVYSAEERAQGNSGWQNWTADMLEKGQGYIFRCSKGGTLTLCVEKADNGISWAAENRPLTLTSAPADDAQDASWNFLGNPQTSYYDIDKTGYTQPITVWNGSGYEAVRAEDDAYALKPFEAFFVQKPNSTSEIQFPADGRYTQTQWEQEKTTKAAARRLEGVKTDRLLVNLVLTDGQEKDKTRVVFNEKTSKDYEIDCDAVKFMSSERVPQLYTIDQRKTRYAINERPMGEVRLGYKAINKGELTIKAMRMDQPVMLRDNLLQITHDLSIGDYTFTTEAGTNESRFMLVVDNSATNVGKLRQETGVSVMADEGGISFLGISEEPVNVYSIGGVLMAGNVSNGFLSLPKATYLVKVGTETAKVIVR